MIAVVMFMKVRYSEEMKKQILVYSTSGGICILLYFIIAHFAIIREAFYYVSALAFPFILGFAIAFLLNQPMLFIERRLLGKTKLKQSTKRSISAIGALLLGILIVVLFLWIVIPQLFDSLMMLADKIPGYVEGFQEDVEALIAEHNIDLRQIQDLLGDQSDIFSKITTYFTDLLPQMLSASYQFGKTLMNILIGIVAGLYILLDKERFSRNVKRANYAFLPKGVADYLSKLIHIIEDIFNNFIVGKAIDSLIIGILCYIGLNVFGFPYAPLLAFVVGITNMIPVFGPFIGAVPGILILLIIEPMESLYFALFILVLQQFDGNILGPLILGDKLGLPSLAILFSVCVGGGLFGIVGMFIGVPTFAVLYYAIKELIDYRLEKKQIKPHELELKE